MTKRFYHLFLENGQSVLYDLVTIGKQSDSNKKEIFSGDWDKLEIV